MPPLEGNYKTELNGGNMARLSELTDTAAVQEAVEEWLAWGRSKFLAHYEMHASTGYFILTDDGSLVDTKPIISVAYDKQHKTIGGLPPSAFSGGEESAKRRLTALGFTVATRAQINPPRLHARFNSRTDIRAAFGGDYVAGIIRFPGDGTVNVFSDEDGPYADQEPSMTEPFGYRGAGLSGDQSLSSAGNKRLEQARVDQQPIRFWYKPSGEPFSFLTWAVVIGRAWTRGIGTDGLDRAELEWTLQAVATDNSSDWSDEVQQAMSDAIEAGTNDKSSPEASPGASYEELFNRVLARGSKPNRRNIVRTDPVRSTTAREAVLLRAEGQCESPLCNGMAPEPNRKGEAILDVDHIVDLAKGGDDDPLNMVAICPNCHAAKTRGARGHMWRRKLLAKARSAHEAMLMQ